ncbi:vacuolar protein sorting-associated protein 35 [Kockiozyma suomiensis]|uniref:vacuolar protein sorting-associated protein 35 n=1 Tax=Kockiozyma suomiensis TaxID=1337062 RepID=UPI003343B781
MSTPIPAPSKEEQARLLEDALSVVRQQSHLMLKNLESKGKLMDALKHASSMLSELRTSSLGPKQYYELYMSVFDSMRNLSVYLKDNHPNNHLADLYELVQYAGNILPRLYLMVTVGTVYMSVPEAPVKEILKDMMEMCRGVQHPIRGLFLRYYLSGQSRDCLPIGDSDGPEGNLTDSIHFVITNFIEMNKLWVRLQHQGHSREREKRMKERQELQILIGSNLVRLSQLDGVDAETYKTTILPAILEQVVQCRDILAQEYLLEVITQVFPDDFHLQTLDLFLSATGKLNPGVNVKNIVISMIDRLAAYANREAESQSPEIRKEREEAQMKKLTAAVRRIRFRGDLAEEYGLFKDHTIEEPEETSVEAEAVASVAPPMPVLDGGWGDSTTATDESDATEATTAETADSEVDSEAEHADTEETPATEEDVPDDSSSDGGLFGKDDDDDPIREFAPNAAAGRKAIIVDKPIVESRDLLEEIRLFEVFFEQIQLLIKARPDLPIGDVTALLVSLTNLCLNCYPAELEYIDQIMGFTLEKCEEYKDNADLHSPPAKNNILALLLAPISSYKSLLNVLAIPNYLHLLHAQSYATRRSIAAAVAHSILKNYTKLEAPEDVEGVAELLRVVIKEGQQPAVPFSSTSAPTGQLNGGAAPAKRKDAETEETVEEQGWLARMVHLIESDIPDVQFRMLQLAKKAFSEGGDRIKYTFPALVTSSVKLVQTYWGKRFVDNAYAQKIVATFKFSHQLITEMYAAGTSADTCLRLYIFCGQIADQVESEEVAFEFFAQAYIVFEEALTDSRAQFQALSIIAGALHSTRNFTKESYETLITKNALFGSKLLKKPDQCRAVYFASHLWWAVEIPVRGEEEGKTPLYRDGKRVLECLQRALRVADACMDSAVSIELFVEILNRYVYYFDRGCEVVTVKYVNGLISLIMSNLSSTIDASVTDSPRKHFERTLQYINAQKEEDERFDQITW